MDQYYSEVDIVLSGDSYLSASINQPFDVVSQLRNLTNLKILNLGLNGSGPLTQYLRIKFFTENTKFTTLIIFFYEGNDHQETSGYLDTVLDIKKNYNYDQINPFNSEDFKVKDNNQINIFILFKIFLSEHLRGISTFYSFFRSYPDLLNEDEYKNILINTKQFLNKKNINNTYLYYIPKFSRHALHKISLHPQLKQLDNLKKNVKNISESNGFKFIDGNEAFKDVKDPLNLYHYKYPTHFNAFGHKLMAEYLYKIIKND